MKYKKSDFIKLYKLYKKRYKEKKYWDSFMPLELIASKLTIGDIDLNNKK